MTAARRTQTIAFALLLSSLATGAFSADQSALPIDTSLTPAKIYLQSIHAMKAQPLPTYVTFRENVVGRNMSIQCTHDGIEATLHHGDVTAPFDVWFRTSDGTAVSRPIGDANAKSCPATLLVPTGAAVASMGIPQPSSSPGTAPEATQPASSIGPPLIAAVHAEAARYYDIELVGIERLGTSDAYHLKLRALRDRDTHPLTDLFIDPETFLVREARGEVSGHYVVASGRLAGVVDFDRVGAYWLVEREHFDMAANALFVHARMTVTIDASNIATPSELPGIVFPAPRPAVSSTH